jgi:hypothetical protein
LGDGKGVFVAKVSELIEQARALEAQGEAAKALAIYQHVLPHLEGMPAIKADLSLKAGDIMLKLGNTSGALSMYEVAGTQCAQHGSSKGALTVASKIQQAAPGRTDVLLSLAGQMVKHGHAGPAVDVLIQHAKQANLPQMLQELQPLAGRPSDDVRPLVEMLLDQPTPTSTPSSPSGADSLTVPRRQSGPAKPALGDDLTLTPMSLEDQLSTLPPTPTPTPAPPAPLPTHAVTGPRPAFVAPPAPPAAPSTPPFEPPPQPLADAPLDLSPPLPLSARETAAINLRTSQIMREAVEREAAAEAAAEAESPAPPRRPSAGQRRPILPPPQRASGGGSGKRKWLVIPVVLAGAVAGLVYFKVLPSGVGSELKSAIPSTGGSKAPARDSVPAAPVPVAPVAAKPAESQRPPTDSFKLLHGPATVRGAPVAAPVAQDTGRQPPVKIDGLMVVDFSETPAGFQVVQRQISGRYLLLTGKPLADTVGEPAVGEVRMDSLPGDSAVAVTNFEGYVVTVRGVISPSALQSLLLQLVSRGH